MKRFAWMTTLVVIGLGTSASATPIAISFSLEEFEQAKQEHPHVTEDFSGFALGNQQSPLIVATGTITGERIFISRHNVDMPKFLTHTCNLDATDCGFTAPTTFSDFPAGTTTWGAHFYQSGLSAARYGEITVEGASGTLHIPNAGFNSWNLAFHDPQGLTSVTLRADALGAYQVLDVTTVFNPEPSSAFLAAMALVPFGVRYVRHKAWKFESS
jgi:hypothetical protein